MELITKNEFARRLNKSTRTIDRWRQVYDLHHAVGPKDAFPRFRWDAIARDIEAGEFPKKMNKKEKGQSRM